MTAGVAAPASRPWVGHLWWLPYAIVIVGALAMFGQTVEDPFITLRYADNLRHGHGPVFTVGERVEGFTSPLHLLVALVALELPGGTPLLWAKLLSLLFALLLVREVGRLTTAIGGGDLAVLLARLLVATNLAVWTVAGNGLETTLWCWLLVLALRVVVDDTRTGWWKRSAAALIVALLARPDMLVIGPVVIAARAYVRRDRAPVVRLAAAFGAVVVALTAARLAYYGQLLPNTYYAKAAPIATSVRAGLSYLLDGVGTDVIARERSSAFRLVGVFANLAWLLPALAGARAGVRRDRTVVPIVAAVLAATAVVIRAGGDWMGGARFGVPLLALLSPFAGCWLAARAAAHRPRPWAPVAAITAAVLFTQVLSPHHPWWKIDFATEDRAFVTQGPGPFPAFWVAASDVLDRCAQPGWLVAGSEMGFAPFHHPELRFLDLRGLVSDDVSHAPAELKGTAGVTDEHWFEPDSPVGRVLLARRPELILTFDAPPGQSPPPVALDGAYRSVDVIPGEGVSERVYARADVTTCG
ncbi:MAG: hypothetical protein ABIV94_07105 [Acidimicrobiales bacterium]